MRVFPPSRPPCRPGTLPVSDLPAAARVYAELPYSPVTEVTRQYHLRVYERWCAAVGEAPWPPTLEGLMRFAAERAQTKAYFTVREHVRTVSMVERKRSGVDLYAAPAMQQLLEGVKRDHRPRPVQPLRRSQLDALFDFRPQRSAQRVGRGIALLAYCCGFTIGEHVRLRVEMVRFAGEGAWIEELGDDRPLFYVGPARNPDRCPVRALSELIGTREVGPVFRGARCRSADGSFRYMGVERNLRCLGRAAGVTPLSNDRLRLAGMIEQSRNIDIVRLAHFHGYRGIEGFADLLGRHVPTSVAVWKRRRGRRDRNL